MPYGYCAHKDPYSQANLIHGQPYTSIDKESTSLAHRQWLDSLSHTHYFCPACLEREERKYLRIQNNGKYLCPKCEGEFVTVDIIESYEGTIDSWRSDADWLESACKGLHAGNKRGL